MLEHDPAKDITLVKDGVVVQVARAPCDPSWFGEAPDGDMIDFEPNEAFPGMLWDGATLTAPEPPEQPTPRRRIPKSVVQERVNSLGKWAAVAALLYTDALPNIYYARWFAPDWPNVYADDATLLALLAEAELTSDDIATVTAP